MKKLILLCLFSILFNSQAFGATYTVKTSGGDYSAPGTCANAVSAGDICEVYNGTYSGWTQTTSGTAGNFITIRAAAGQSPALSSSIALTADYIVIQGFAVTGGGITTGSTYSGAAHSNLQVVDNTFTGSGGSGIALSMKGDDILISGNSFSNWGNDIVRQFGIRWTIRNNTAIGMTASGAEHMDFWQSFCSGPTVDIKSAQYGLIENNVFINITGNGNEHFALVNGTSTCAIPPIGMIFRYNKVHSIGSLGVYIDANQQASGTTRNVVYNNTFSYLSEGTFTWEDASCALNASTNSSAINNLHDTAMKTSGARGFYFSTGGAQSYNLYYSASGTMTFSGGASNEVGAVKNQNPLLIDPLNNNFSLQAGSPAIDTGGPLTTVAAADTGSGTSLIVGKAEFFQPGWGGASADWIAVGSIGNTAQISSIDYSTNTITLAAGISRNDGDSVWLYKKSDGVQVLLGAAPDIGAEEYSGGPIVSGLLPSGSQGCTSDPRNVTLQATTNENATCRYHATATTWAGMSEMSTTGTTSHSQVVSLACNASYSHNILCQDAVPNESTMGEWSFNIAASVSGTVMTIGPGGSIGLGTGGSFVINP